MSAPLISSRALFLFFPITEVLKRTIACFFQDCLDAFVKPEKVRIILFLFLLLAFSLKIWHVYVMFTPPPQWFVTSSAVVCHFAALF